MPLNDRGVWLCNLLSDDKNIKIAGASGYLAAFALDKRMQIEAARYAGFRVPNSYFLNNQDDISRVTNFPVILKPALAVAEDNGRLIQKKRSVFLPTYMNLKRNNVMERNTTITGSNRINRCRWRAFRFRHRQWYFLLERSHARQDDELKGSGSSACRSESVDKYPIQQAKTCCWVSVGRANLW